MVSIDVIARAKEGDEEAFCLIVQEYQAQVRGYIARFVLDSNDVFDLAQEAFVAAFHRIDTFREEEGEMGAWLRGIARTTSLEHLRKTRRRRRREANAVELAILRRAEERLEHSSHLEEDKLERLQECVGKVKNEDPERFRLLEMRYFKSLSISRIARELRSGDGAVRMALLRVRRLLRECVEKGLAMGGVRNV